MLEHALTRALWCTAIVATLTACSSKSSSNGGDDGGPIATADMQIDLTVAAEDDQTVTVSVSLHDGESVLRTEYFLTGGDALSACIGAQCKPLEHDAGLPLAGDDYAAQLPYVAELPYVIAFSRRVGQSAPNSFVTLPVPFSILAPATGTAVTDGDSVTVQWSPSGIDERVYVTSHEVRCEHADGGTTDWFGPRFATDIDGGSFTVAIADVLRSLPVFASTGARVLRCEIDLEVTHERRGNADAVFDDGGRIFGRVTRSITLAYTPATP